MAKAKYCNLCNRMVIAEKKWKWSKFFICGLVPYIIFFIFFKRKQCPICNNKKLKRKTPETN